MLVDPADTVHIAWHSHGTGGPTGGPIHATITPGGATTTTAIESPRHDGWDPSLALDPQGNLHLATVYPSSYNTPASLQHGVHDGTAWQHDTIADSGLFIFGHGTTIGIDSAGRPRIAYTDTDTYTGPGNLVLATLDAGSWAFDTLVDGAASGVPAGRFPSLAIDDQDRVHLAWIDLDPSNTLLGTVRYGLLDGGSWTTQTVDTLDTVRVGSINGRRQVSLQLDANDQPHLGYGDRRAVRYAELADGAWDITPVAASTTVLYNGQVDLRLDAGGDPILAFWQTHPDEPGLVRLAAPIPDPSADFDSDGDTDLSDLLAWQAGYGIVAGAAPGDGDADHDGDVDDQDLAVWQSEVNSQAATRPTPEPTAATLAAIAALLLGCRRQSRRSVA